MIKANYHTHYSICDGTGEARDYVETALKKGFTALGFSSHAPVPFETSTNMKTEDLPRYLKEIKELQAAYQDTLEIFLGLEIDHIHENPAPQVQLAKQTDLDYTIGSFHCMWSPQNGCYREIDNTPDIFKAILQEDFNGNIVSLVTTYYTYMAELLEKLHPTILGHFDLIKKNNLASIYFKESDNWYREAVLNVFPFIRKCEPIVEVNTGGIARKKTDQVYPSPWILYELKKEDIPVMVNTDAHTPELLDAYIEEARYILRDTGYRKVWLLRREGWVTENL
jgi:histidinol-phosphatase (PHP family)